MAGTSAEFTGKVGPHTVQRTPGSDLPSALSCIDPAPDHLYNADYALGGNMGTGSQARPKGPAICCPRRPHRIP